MSFANPGALWGLLGLMVPILIHLFNANRGRLIHFGDTRFIDEAQARQMRNVFPTELLLLLLRCLLLAALVMLLARPGLEDRASFSGPTAVLISPLALANASPATLVTAREIARQSGAELRLLGAGFPSVTSLTSVPEVQGGAFSLLAELEHRLPVDQSVVLLLATDNRESGWRRPHLSHSVQAIEVVPGAAEDPPRLQVALVADADRQADLVYLRAALASLSLTGLPLDMLETGQESQADIAFVLGASNHTGAPLTVRDAPAASGSRARVMAWQDRSFDIRLHQPIGAGEPLLVDQQGDPVAQLVLTDEASEIRWNARFNPEHAAIVGDGEFPDLLSSMLLAGWPALANQRSLTRPGMISRPSDPLAPVWAVLIAVIWLAERYLATPRRIRE
jgi:hypothetical protein